MEGIHGVDVSWLHHSQRGKFGMQTRRQAGEGGNDERPREWTRIGVSKLQRPARTSEAHGSTRFWGCHKESSKADPGARSLDHNHRSKASKANQNHASDNTTPNRDTAKESPPSSPSPGTPSVTTPQGKNNASSPSSSPTATSLPHHMHRPHLARRSSSEKQATPTTPTTPTTKSSEGATSPTSPTTARRNSWLTGLTSKFSSSNSVPQPPPQATPPSSVKTANEKPKSSPQYPPGRRASLTEATPPPKDESTPYIPAAPKATHSPSFLQSALRRLSSSSGQLPAASRTGKGGGICERRVMNIDQDRERCKISELHQGKLRRVAFCVDVEIAGGPRYLEDDGGAGETHHKKHQEKEKRLKEKGEGEALKHPELVQEEKENHGDIKVDGEAVEAAGQRGPNTTEPELETAKPDAQEEDEKKEPSKKKEKKKRSEEERKERKERKRRHAEANGSIPIETVLNGDESPPGSTPPGASTPNSQDRPTTDPLRIYRRCCQLRETPVLKKITEQLSAHSSAPPATPGVVTAVDLSGYWMQLADVVTLSDWLAVVPVKKLILENCGLSDEAVRVVLAGLLAARPPNTGRERSLTKDSTASHGIESGRGKHEVDRHDVIEKLVLKNNPKIGPEGWRHISLFLHLSWSLKAVDLSMIPFPQEVVRDSGTPAPEDAKPAGALETLQGSSLLSKAIAERFAGGQLEELVMSECDLRTKDILNIVDGVSKIRLKRLGLASNNIDRQGLERIADFVKSGRCEGLDIGGNDISDLVPIIAGSLDDKCPLWALSLADCNLTPASLSKLFPALATLPSCRFLDFSHNPKLFESDPDALGLCRKYLPRLTMIKRFHLADVSLTAEHAVALADILPECTTLAHFSILENPKISALANAKDEASMEEACALYASLMAAVRVSPSIICIDVDVPSPESSEIVQALAKQVVAYSLRNMEHGAVAEYGATASKSDSHEENYLLPEVLMHLVGHDEQYPDHQDVGDPAPDEDYVIGGTGVVKALSICLGSTAYDSRRQSRDHSAAASGSVTPKAALKAADGEKSKPKVVSTNLLASARKIRARLQPALAREAKAGDEMSYRRLLFLEQTLNGIIRRFEDEYPECRVNGPRPDAPPPLDIGDAESVESSPETASLHSATSEPQHLTDATSPTSDDEGSVVHAQPESLSRHASDVSIASKALSNEEGRMHRIGQQVRRDMLRPSSRDGQRGGTDVEATASETTHMDALRERLSTMTGDELRRMYDDLGVSGLMKELGANLEELKALAEEDPEAFEAFRISQLTAMLNVEMDKGDAVAESAATTRRGEDAAS